MVAGLGDRVRKVLALFSIFSQVATEPESLDKPGTKMPTILQELISERLSNKLKVQLSDPLAVASGTLPEWCQELVTLCPSAFPLDLRLSLFAAVAFGVDRAVASLQIAHDRSPQRVSTCAHIRSLTSVDGWGMSLMQYSCG